MFLIYPEFLALLDSLSERLCFLTGRGAKKLPGRSRPISAIKRLATASGAVIQILLLRRL